MVVILLQHINVWNQRVVGLKWNLHSSMCQLYSDKVGEKKNLKKPLQCQKSQAILKCKWQIWKTLGVTTTEKWISLR